MKELEDRGYGRREARTARNNRKVSWFIARRRASGSESGPSRAA